MPDEAPQGKGLTYKDAGVDTEAKDEAARGLTAALSFARTGMGAPIGGAGHYAGMVAFGEHALVLCTDGVGTKLEVATALAKWDTIGIDCIAMNVNDAICVGAEPIAFVDYLAVEKVDQEQARQIGAGLAEGARQANVSIVGGETAILPEIVKGFDLAGTALAVVERERIIDGSRIQPGDVVIGVASSGIHSNGLTLARRVFSDAGLGYDAEIAPGLTVGAALLEPTRIYVRPVVEMLRDVPVHGLAHVTGSGLLNLPRLAKGVRFVLDDPLPPHPVFRAIQEHGKVSDHEMYKTFNMGMGLAVVAAPEHAPDVVRTLGAHWETKVVGRIEEGATGVDVPPLGLSYDGAKF